MAIIPIDSNLLLTPLRPLTTATLSSGAAAKPQPIAKGAPLAPWQTPAAQPSDQLVNRLLSAKPLINLNDPLVARAGGNASYTAMFAAYQALGRILEAAEYATTNRADGLRTTINSRFKSNIAELMDFVSKAAISDVTVIAGIKQSAVSSTTIKPTTPTVYTGATVTTVREDAVPGLTGTEKFTIKIEKDGTSQDVLVDLAGMTSTLNLDNLASYINTKLTDAGVSARVEVTRKNETAYSLSVVLGLNEKATFTPDAANTEPALYLAGTSGGADFADGVLRKLDGLSAAAPAEDFLNRISTDKGDAAKAVATDSQGNVYVLGTTAGNLGGEVNRSGTLANDVTLSKYDAAGNLIFTRMLGATGDADGMAITVDANDNVLIAGRTEAKLDPSAFGGLTDSFVTKFSSTGQELWTRQAGAVLGDAAMAITTDASGNIFVGGRTQGVIPGATTSEGADDAYVSKLDANGALQWSKQFGTSGNDQVTGLKVDANGDLVVSGTMNGSAFVRKYADSATDDPPIWAVDLGSVGEGAATGLSIDDSGRIFVSGFTSTGTLNGSVAQAYGGGNDGFVTRIDDGGGSASISYVSYLGGTGDDRALGVAALGGNLYLSGDTTGSIGGQTQNGARDGFAAKFDAATGTLTWAKQFGGAFSMTGGGIALDTSGTSVVTQLGLSSEPYPREADGLVTSTSSARAGEFFSITVNGGITRKITLDAGDSYNSLSVKLNQVLGRAGRAAVSSTGALSITAVEGSDIRIEAGAKGRDLLASLGIEPTRLFGSPPFKPPSKISDAVESFVGGSLAPKEKKSAAAMVYDLGLSKGLNLSSKKDAEDAVSVVKSAMQKLRDAFRYSVTGVDPNQTKPSIASPNAYMQSKISMYSAALQRLESNQGSSQSSVLGLFGI